MLDNTLIPILRQCLIDGMTAFVPTLTNLQVKQNFQPTNQGVNTAPSLYFSKVGDHRYGFRSSEDYWDQTTSKLVHEEHQIYEAMFQINALSIQDPANVTQLTASDILNYAAAVMQSDMTIATLLANDLSVYRITDVRNPHFVDDKDRFEAEPSFDFTIQHEQVIILESPVVEKFVFNTLRV